MGGCFPGRTNNFSRLKKMGKHLFNNASLESRSKPAILKSLRVTVPHPGRGEHHDSVFADTGN